MSRTRTRPNVVNGGEWIAALMVCCAAGVGCDVSSETASSGATGDAGNGHAFDSAVAPEDTGPRDSSPESGSSGATDAAVVERDAPGPDAAESDVSAPNGPGTFVAVGYGGRRTRSLDDGLTWVDDQTLEANGGDDSLNLRAAGAGAGTFLALGFITMSSTDGNVWNNIGTNLDNWVGSAMWDGHQFVVVGGWGIRETSPDGTVWTENGVSGDTISIHPSDALTMGNGRYLAIADNGMATMSADAVTWTNGPADSAKENAHLAFGNGVFSIAAGTTVFRSTDGITITQVATLGAAAGAIVFAQGHFTVLSVNHVYTSDDGTTWTDHANQTWWGGSSLVFGDGTYIAIDGEGVRRSVDGITWSQTITNGSTEPLNAVTFAAF